jgi:peptidoglycan/xylan/chitin deacetylase (PgdA/CDA1 family)
MKFTLLFPSFKARAVTFSYDDGVLQDQKVVSILNKHHLKGTFNLNGGQSGQAKERDGIDCSHLKLEESVSVYEGHEIANHTYSHPHLEGLPYECQTDEYEKNKAYLEKVFRRSVSGFAYPYGTYDATTLKVLGDLKVHYARTTRSTYDFHRPYDWLLWHPTIHHNDPLLMPTLQRFYESEEELPIFFLWGHGYEFALQNNFSVLEDFCKDIDAHSDVWSATNEEIFTYIQNAKMLYWRKGLFVNPSSSDIFFRVGGNQLKLSPHSQLAYEEVKE